MQGSKVDFIFLKNQVTLQYRGKAIFSRTQSFARRNRVEAYFGISHFIVLLFADGSGLSPA
jgi:hypothetical protein